MTTTRDKGTMGEHWCDAWMESIGARVLAKNRRLGGLEFDRVYNLARQTWFVEVKSCLTSDDASWGRERAMVWLCSRQCRRQQSVVQAWWAAQKSSQLLLGSVLHVLVVLTVGPNEIAFEAYETCSGLLLRNGVLCA
jgi:Holliday junction resolvase-like predicted endonuclease